MKLVATIPRHRVKVWPLPVALCVGFVLVWSRGFLKIYKG